ncbi:MAG: flagellar hook-basal body complex protein FliE [Gammaproteobacteria bacterium]|nr:flagellar hook-basal body complex protein FliE [Gammaproteobacteria bacterium]MDH5652944.1 flagellar hook-basal body complex protein FliE [Gammaproteobacteria bacterium]
MANNTINPDTLLIQMRAMAAQIQQKQAAAPESVDKADSFSELLKQSINQVNNLQQEGNQLATAFQKGDPNVQMSEVMVSLQKANVSFQAMIEVRNKLVSAYQEIMNMQV